MRVFLYSVRSTEHGNLLLLLVGRLRKVYDTSLVKQLCAEIVVENDTERTEERPCQEESESPQRKQSRRLGSRRKRRQR